VQKGLPLLGAYADRCTVAYDAYLGEADFLQDPKGASATINSWVAGFTGGLIDNLFEPVSLGPGPGRQTAAVLGNATFFRATWRCPFTEGQTREEAFRVSSTETVKVPTMTQEAFLVTRKGDGFSGILLRYWGLANSMGIFIPADERCLSGVPPELIEKCLGTPLSEDEEVAHLHVWVPKFVLDSRLDLVSVLDSLGVGELFSPQRCDLSGATNHDSGLWVSAVTHHGVVDVNERGTLAAAATGIQIDMTSLPGEFRANRPFLFFIRDDRTGTVLFLGRLSDPRTKPGKTQAPPRSPAHP